jgi:glycosyltransferase involved in cell wall biosynthesis
LAGEVGRPLNVSVIIPAYNCAGTIRATLDSALSQTLQPDEILVMDDGSTDGTPAVLGSYGRGITVVQRPNGGVASARNALCARARGSLLAFLDSDDLWHPRYLEAQFRLFCEHPEASLFFVGHETFREDDAHTWPEFSAVSSGGEVIPPLAFFELYNRAPGPFCSYSFCCVPRRVLDRLGATPFRVDGVEDFYCTPLLCLLGPAVYCPAPLGAYRVRGESLSSRRLESLGARVCAFELLREEHYGRLVGAGFGGSFRSVFASHRRQYAKYLLGAGRMSEGRMELVRSLCLSVRPLSLAKSAGLLLLTYMPARVQPAWPTRYMR